jgi:hypothetical protein
MLSKSEKDFIEGKLKPNSNYKYVLIHRIRRKKEKMIKELHLINSFLEKMEKIKKDS